MIEKYILMGVSGCGKSLIGAALAARLAVPFFDGDDYHPTENINKMRRGIPLTDSDRFAWLTSLNRLVIAQNKLVLACSALRPEYRQILSQNGAQVQFIYLMGDYETIAARLSKRRGHYFQGDAMLRSQFAALVPPAKSEAIQVQIDQAPEAILEAILTRISPPADS